MTVDPHHTAGEPPIDWLDWTTVRQQQASDPARSVWVSANAGSGKTHVLTQRVIRLLLSGCRPSSILCLTYTKAAASEMSNRVFERLAEWVTLDDDQLAARLTAMQGSQPSLAMIAEARRLFARALETPGGLKIQTIHAFCEAVLHQFPLEANVAGHFSVLDDRAAAALMADARRMLLTATASEETSALAAAFSHVLDLADDTGLETLLAAIIANRNALRAFRTAAEARGGAEPVLRDLLGLDADDRLDRVLGELWPPASMPGPQLSAYIDLARNSGGAKPSAFADGIATLTLPMTPEERLDRLSDLFFGKNGKPFADGTFFNAAMLKAAPQLCAMILDVRAHVEACFRRIAALRQLDSTLAALTLADRLNDDYDDLKKSRSLLDFDDLILLTARLLTRDDVNAWVHYKLDRGIDHILVDEAQDTSPVQWSIIRSLADEFFAGQSARPEDRTIFAVGDAKQSIYSFQGAQPERFALEGRNLRDRVKGSGNDFQAIDLHLSFRSTADVLSSVDAVFAVPEHARGLGMAGEAVQHVSNRMGQPGSVDIWDMIEPAASPDESDWTAPFDSTPEAAPENVLAQRIAATLDAWIGHEPVFEKGVTRPMRPGDVIILVRKRGPFVNALTRALKKRGRLPVAGADRLVLTSHIAVQDLLALGRFLLLAQDDLSLASVLKSPLFNVSEEDLLDLASARGVEQTLWQRLASLAQTEPGADAQSTWHEIYRKLERYRELALRRPVFDLFANVLGPDGGRAAFVGRLGSEVSDILDEFLTFCLEHERQGLPGLQGFVSALEMEAPTVKREQDKGRDEIRIMTVHAAKGLEAAVVFLVDGGGKAFHSQHLPALRLLPRPDQPAIPLWQAPGVPTGPQITEDTERLKAAAEEEYRRLLYVGMTRAADRLVVCGFRKKTVVKDCWHAMITQSLTADPRFCTPHTFRQGGLEWQGHRWRSTPEALYQPESGETSQQDPADILPLPDTLLNPLPVLRGLPRPLSPSGLGLAVEGSDEPVGSALFSGGAARTAGDAMQRGAIQHRFFQVLPDLPQEERPAAALRYLARAVPHWDERKCQLLLDPVLRTLDRPDLADVFGPNSRAEVSVMGTIRLGHRDFAVSGRIDRLAVTDETVTIVDFKTGRQIPQDIDAVAPVHAAQLAIYREVLKPLYPGRTLRCLLVFTAGPAVIELPQTTLDASLERLSAT